MSAVELRTKSHEFQMNEPVKKRRKTNPKAAKSKTDIVRSIPDLVKAIEEEMNGEAGVPLEKRSRIESALRNYKATCGDWRRYRYVDERKRYTRNLIATDNKTFALMLLCWNPSQDSPIHDHECDGCWVRCLEGAVREVRYTKKEGKCSTESKANCCVLQETVCTTVTPELGVTFMHNSVGYHKIGNFSDDVACTLHLYAPPYQTVRVWEGEGKHGNYRDVQAPGFDTEYGVVPE
jgi:cysteine dioxygenase